MREHEYSTMTIEGKDLSTTFAANPLGRMAISFDVYPDPDDVVCRGHVEFFMWVNWILTQEPEDDEYYH